VQDFHVGDIGDFGKDGLLRWLCPAHNEQDNNITLGANWCYAVLSPQRASPESSYTYLQSSLYKLYDPETQRLLISY
jgi:hypothetical protein